ncbi:4660_t:CDS:1, partial [Scutellospora calospora]
AFDGIPFDTKLCVKICDNNNPLRPEFAPGTPDYYIKLAKECTDANPQRRPNATEINHSIGYWLCQMKKYDENYFKKQFLDADIVEPEPVEPKHPSLMYTSKLVNILDNVQTG